ncbi:hypothetical protein SpCBS45565_g05444 [Spizellomyces sp. 'palustris']|nr:hypothetical protein SpCBS45565_g05444 [Spizellomyces sp. 'palustris']
MSTTQSFMGQPDPDRIPIFINSLPDRERRIHKARRAPAPSTAPPGGPSSYPTSDGNARSNLARVGGLVTSGMGSRKVSFHADVGGPAKAAEHRKRARKVIQSTLSAADYHGLPMTSLQSFLQPATPPLSPPRRHHFQRKQGSTIRSDTLEELRASSNVVLSPRKKPKIGDSASAGPPGEYSRPRQVDPYSAPSGFNDGGTIQDGATVQPSIKQKPYNPEEVREYMKQKRKQRKKKQGLDVGEVMQEHHHMRTKPYDAEKVRAYMQQKLLQRDLEEKAKKHASKEKAKKTADMLDKLDLYRRQQREILRRKLETDTKRGFTFRETVHTESGDGMADSGPKVYPDSQDIAAGLNAERLNHDVDKRKDAGITHLETDEAEVQKRALKRVRSDAKDVTAIAPLHRSLSAPIHKEIETELPQLDQQDTPRQAWLPQPNTSPISTGHTTKSQRNEPNATFQKLQALMATAEALHQRIFRTLPDTDDDTSVTESCADQSSMDLTKENDVAPSPRQSEPIRNEMGLLISVEKLKDYGVRRRRLQQLDFAARTIQRFYRRYVHKRAQSTVTYRGQTSTRTSRRSTKSKKRTYSTDEKLPSNSIISGISAPLKKNSDVRSMETPVRDHLPQMWMQNSSNSSSQERSSQLRRSAPSPPCTSSIGRGVTHPRVEPLPPLGDLESPPIGDKYSVINIFTRKFTIGTLVAPRDAKKGLQTAGSQKETTRTELQFYDDTRETSADNLCQLNGGVQHDQREVHSESVPVVINDKHKDEDPISVLAGNRMMGPQTAVLHQAAAIESHRGQESEMNRIGASNIRESKTQDTHEMEASCDDEVKEEDIIGDGASDDQPSIEEDLDPDSRDSEQQDTQSQIESAYELSEHDNNPEIMTADGLKEFSERFESLPETSVGGPSPSNRMNEDISHSQFSDSTDSSAVSSDYSTSRSQADHSSFYSRRHKQPPRTGRRNYHRAPRRHGSTRDELLCPSGRLSPHSLSRKLMAEINLLEAIEESRIQLAELETTGRTAFAQSEAVTLTQILAERQSKHDRDLEEAKCERELKEAQRGLGAHGVAETESRTENQRNDMYDEDFEDLSDFLSVGGDTVEPAGDDVPEELPPERDSPVSTVSDHVVPVDLGTDVVEDVSEQIDLESDVNPQDEANIQEISGDRSNSPANEPYLSDFEPPESQQASRLSTISQGDGDTPESTSESSALAALVRKLHKARAKVNTSHLERKEKRLETSRQIAESLLRKRQETEQWSRRLKKEEERIAKILDTVLRRTDADRRSKHSSIGHGPREQQSRAPLASTSKEHRAIQSKNRPAADEEIVEEIASEEESQPPSVVESLPQKHSGQASPASPESVIEEDIMHDEEEVGNVSSIAELQTDPDHVSIVPTEDDLSSAHGEEDADHVSSFHVGVESESQQQLSGDMVEYPEQQVDEEYADTFEDAVSEAGSVENVVPRRSSDRVSIASSEDEGNAIDAEGDELARRIELLRRQVAERKRKAKLLYQEKLQKQQTVRQRMRETEMKLKRELEAINSIIYRTEAEIETLGVGVELDVESHTPSSTASIAPQPVSIEQLGQAATAADASGVILEEYAYDSDSFVPIVESSDLHKDGPATVEEVQSEYDNDSFVSSAEPRDIHEGEMVAEDNPAAVEKVYSEYDKDSFVSSAEPSDVHKGEMVAEDSQAAVEEVQDEYDSDSFVPVVGSSDVRKGEMFTEDGPAAVNEGEYDSNSVVSAVEAGDLKKKEMLGNDRAATMEEPQDEHDNAVLGPTVETKDPNKETMLTEDQDISEEIISEEIEEQDDEGNVEIDMNESAPPVQALPVNEAAQTVTIPAISVAKGEDEYDSGSFVSSVETNTEAEKDGSATRVQALPVNEAAQAVTIPVTNGEDEYDSDSFISSVEVNTEAEKDGSATPARASFDYEPTQTAAVISAYTVEKDQAEVNKDLLGPTVETKDPNKETMLTEDQDISEEIISEEIEEQDDEGNVEIDMNESAPPVQALPVNEAAQTVTIPAISVAKGEGELGSDLLVSSVAAKAPDPAEQDAILEQAVQDVKLDVDLAAKGLETSVDPSAEEDIVDQLLADLLDDAIQVMKSVGKQGAKDRTARHRTAPVEQQGPLPDPPSSETDIHPISTDTTTDQIANLILQDVLSEAVTTMHMVKPHRKPEAPIPPPRQASLPPPDPPLSGSALSAQFVHAMLETHLPPPDTPSGHYTHAPQLPPTTLDQMHVEKRGDYILNRYALLFDATNEALSTLFAQQSSRLVRARPLTRAQVVERTVAMVRGWKAYAETHGENLDALLIAEVKEAEKAWKEMADWEHVVGEKVLEGVWEECLEDTVRVVGRVCDGKENGM